MATNPVTAQIAKVLEHIMLFAGIAKNMIFGGGVLIWRLVFGVVPAAGAMAVKKRIRTSFRPCGRLNFKR